MRQTALQCFAVALFVLLTVGLAQRSDGRDWTIRGRKMPASLVQVDGANAVFRLASGKLVRMPTADLPDDEIRRARNLLDLNRMAGGGPSSQAEAIQRMRLQVEIAQYWKPWQSMWVVQMVAPNGRPFWRIYPGFNSDFAFGASMRDYPAAQILFVKRLRRKY